MISLLFQLCTNLITHISPKVIGSEILNRKNPPIIEKKLPVHNHFESSCHGVVTLFHCWVQ